MKKFLAIALLGAVLIVLIVAYVQSMGLRGTKTHATQCAVECRKKYSVEGFLIKESHRTPHRPGKVFSKTVCECANGQRME